MTLIYRALWYVFLPLWAFWHVLFTWRRPEFRQGYWQRYGWVPRQFNHPLVVHAASVGEVNAIAKMVAGIIQNTAMPVLITTSTPTGRDRVQQLFAKETQVSHCYMPVDMGIAVRLFLRRVRPRGILLVETELWPSLIRQAARRNLSVWLINGRLSQRSAKRYKRFLSLAQTMLDNIEKFYLQDQDSARRFAYLGVEEARLSVVGSVKFDIEIPAVPCDDVVSQWRQSNAHCWVCGSTREGEEATLLQAWIKMQAVESGLLVIVPRHPQRFAEVADLCEQSGLPWRKFSQGMDPAFAQMPGRRVLLVDAMGQLIDFYRIADLALVGGSLAPKGGQNPLEPAAIGKAVVMGPHVYNFTLVVEQLCKVGNVRILTSSELVTEIPKLLNDSATLAQMGAAGQQWVCEKRGATSWYVNMIIATFAAEQQHNNEA